MANQWGKVEMVLDFIFMGSEITVDGNCSHKIKRHSLLGRKPMINLDSVLKSRDIKIPTKFHLDKAMVFPVVMHSCESWTIKKAEHQRIDAFELWCWRRLWESLGLPGDPTSPCWRKSTLNIHWKDWCWSWSSNNLATWCKELTHWKRPRCWERLKAGEEEGDDRGWDKVASLTQWTWVWANSGRLWRTEEPGVLQSMG